MREKHTSLAPYSPLDPSPLTCTHPFPPPPIPFASHFPSPSISLPTSVLPPLHPSPPHSAASWCYCSAPSELAPSVFLIVSSTCSLMFSFSFFFFTVFLSIFFSTSSFSSAPAISIFPPLVLCIYSSIIFPLSSICLSVCQSIYTCISAASFSSPSFSVAPFSSSSYSLILTPNLSHPLLLPALSSPVSHFLSPQSAFQPLLPRLSLAPFSPQPTMFPPPHRSLPPLPFLFTHSRKHPHSAILFAHFHLLPFLPLPLPPSSVSSVFTFPSL